MFGQPRFAPPFDRLTQAWHSQPGRERGAKASFLDEAKRTLLTSHAARRQAAKRVIAMRFEARSDRAEIIGTNGSGGGTRRSHREG
jgi:hypothetical protein